MADILTQAVALHNAGQLKEAQALYRRILAFIPDQSDTLHLLGLATWRLGRAEAGAELIRRAIRLNPVYGPFYFNIANLYNGQNDRPTAIDWLERGIATVPDYSQNWETHCSLCQDLAVEAVWRQEFTVGTAWTRRALAVLETLSTLSPLLWDLLERLIQISLVAGDEALALALLQVKNRHDLPHLSPADFDCFALTLHRFADWCTASGFRAESWIAPGQPLPPGLAADQPGYLRRYAEALPELAATPVGVALETGIEVVQGFYVKDNYESFVLAGRRTLLREDTLTMVRSPAVPLVGVTPGATAAVFRLPRADYRVLEIEEPALFLPSTPNYWHFMVEVLPMLMVRERVPAVRDLAIHLFDLRGYHYEMLELAGVGRRQVVDTRALVEPEVRQVLYRFRRAAVTSQIPYPVACRWLRETLLPQVRPDRQTGLPRRVFLSRRGSFPKHRIANDAEVGALLAGYGFEVVQPETLSVLETIELVAQAEIVVAPIGAATANQVFLSPGATWVHLNNPDFYHPDSSWNSQMGTQIPLTGSVRQLTGCFTGDPAAFPTRLVDRLDIPVTIDLAALARLIEERA